MRLLIRIMYIQLLKTGDDFFTEMFAEQYSEQFKPMPAWLEEQIRYPVELFNWKTEMYNIYHVMLKHLFKQMNFMKFLEDLTHIMLRQNHLDLNKHHFWDCFHWN